MTISLQACLVRVTTEIYVDFVSFVTNLFKDLNCAQKTKNCWKPELKGEKACMEE